MSSAWRTSDVTSANSAGRRERAGSLVAGDPSGRLADFRALAASALVSTNVEAFKVEVFDEADEVLDARRIDARRAGDEAAGLAAFRDRQGSWLQRREAFERLWVDGESFIYGALNAGNRGVPRFGDFCLVVGDPAARSRSVALFPEDTAQRYTNGSDVDAERVRNEATAWSDRDALAVVERDAEALTANDDAWPEVVCRENHYLEAVLGPPLPVRDVTEVRLPQPYLDRLEELEVRELAGEDLTPSERKEVSAFSSLQRWRSTHSTTVVGIP